jgi:hypothetical protein
MKNKVLEEDDVGRIDLTMLYHSEICALHWSHLPLWEKEFDFIIIQQSHALKSLMHKIVVFLWENLGVVEEWRENSIKFYLLCSKRASSIVTKFAYQDEGMNAFSF